MDQSLGGKRRTRLAVEQREALLSFMEKNPALATGRFPGSHGSKIKAQLWNDLSEYLNRMGAMGQGTTKTPDRWMKDWRCDVKAKAWRLRSNSGANSGGAHQSELRSAQLTPIEERLLAFMGRECQDDNVIRESIEVLNGQYSEDNEYKFVDNGTLTVDISSPSQSECHLSPVQSSSLSPVTCIAQSTSSYPPGSSHQASNTLSSTPPTSPNLQELKQSPRDSEYSPEPEPEPEPVLIPQPAKRRRYPVETVPDVECEATINTADDRSVVISERLAEAQKARAEASVIEAAAEERKATAAERTATAVEREAAALERKAAAMERLAAAAERKALAAERESVVLSRHPQY